MKTLCDSPRSTLTALLVSGAAIAWMGGCKSNPESSATPPSSASAVSEKAQAEADKAPEAAEQPEVAVATVGVAAPDFTLKDLDGKEVHLADLKGKIVVLEWFNPDCPFVKAAHTQGSLQKMAADVVSGDVVWLAINSGGPGKQGHGAEASRSGAERFGMKHPVLLDESGAVGRAYGAERTPHMFVIDQQGVLVYRGAIDNSPDGALESPSGPAAINYVEQALSAIRAGKPVETAETKPYGCTVKYGES